MRRFASALLLLLTACHAEGALSPVDVTAWAAAKARWRAAGVTHYRYESSVSCFCAPDYARPITVEYRNGVLLDARYSDGTPVPFGYTGRPPIDSLFSEIVQQPADFVDRIDVTYDAQYGYPRTISVTSKSTVADGGYSRTVHRFEVLP